MFCFSDVPNRNNDANVRGEGDEAKWEGCGRRREVKASYTDFRQSSGCCTAGTPSCRR